MVHEALEAAAELVPEGWEIEVVDLRSVKPLDTDTVMASVARTGRLLCVGEAWPWGGVTAEIIARVTSEGYGLLDVPPQRLNAKDTPVPYHPNLWTAHRPTARSVAAAARNLLDNDRDNRKSRPRQNNVLPTSCRQNRWESLASLLPARRRQHYCRDLKSQIVNHQFPMPSIIL